MKLSEMMKSSAGRTALCAVMTALGLLFGYIESLIPLPVPIPGIKIGIANAVTMVCFYLAGGKAAWITALLRISISGLLFGNLYSFLFSLMGGVFSLTVMSIMKRTGVFGISGVSTAGGVMHNMGQIIAAAAVLKTAAVTAYIPALIAGGVISGAVIGIVSGTVINRVKKAGVFIDQN